MLLLIKRGDLNKMKKPKSLDFLVERRELSSEAAEELKKLWVTNANELYGHINIAISHGSQETQEKYACLLGVPVEKLKNYRDYLKPYVSEHVLNTKKTVNPKEYPTGCLITEEQINSLNRNWRAMENPVEHDNLQREQYCRAMSTDSSFKRLCFEAARKDERFRTWLFNGQPYHRFEQKSVYEDMAAKQTALSNEFYEINTNLRRN